MGNDLVQCSQRQAEAGRIGVYEFAAIDPQLALMFEVSHHRRSRVEATV